MGEPKGVILRQPELQRARAMEFVALRIAGKTVADIALQYSCSEDTVRTYINLAGREGLISKAEDRILDELVPLALTTYKTALENGDTFAAKDVLARLGAMAERAEKRQMKNEDRLIEAYFEERREKRKKDADKSREAEGVAAVDGQIIDVTPLPPESSEDDGETPSPSPEGPSVLPPLPPRSGGERED